MQTIKVRAIHELKTWPDFFQHILDGVKPFELRKDDRDFQAGDALLLREYDPKLKEYTGRQTRRFVTYKLVEWEGLSDEFCILGIGPIPIGVSIKEK
jgi:hypothetical protein